MPRLYCTHTHTHTHTTHTHTHTCCNSNVIGGASAVQLYTQASASTADSPNAPVRKCPGDSV
jgi:hypothetical protein